MDYSILNWINNTFGQSKAFAIISRIVTFFGSFWFLSGLVILLLCFKKTRKMGLFVLIAGGFVALFNNFIIKLIVKRERPFATYPELKNICVLAGKKFPKGYSMASGHASVTMSVAVAIMFFSKKWGVVAISGSVLVGLSRLALCVHYPTDVLIGWIIGAALSVGLHYLTIYILKLINLWRNKNEKNSISIEKSEQN